MVQGIRGSLPDRDFMSDATAMTLVKSRDSGDPDVIDFMTVGAIWVISKCTCRDLPLVALSGHPSTLSSSCAMHLHWGSHVEDRMSRRPQHE